MYADVLRAWILFTAIGVVAADPGSVESVLVWADRLQRRFRYLIVENSITARTDFTYWRQSREAQEFQKIVHAAPIQMHYRLAELENATRYYGVTPSEVASRTTTVLALSRGPPRKRAERYPRRLL